MGDTPVDKAPLANPQVQLLAFTAWLSEVYKEKFHLYIMCSCQREQTWCGYPEAAASEVGMFS